MNPVTPKTCGDFPPLPESRTDLTPAQRAESALLLCIGSLGGWVGPHGLATRAELDALVARGVLEVWPGRPLYRIPVARIPTERAP